MQPQLPALIAPRQPWYRWRSAPVLQEQVALVRSNFIPTLTASAAGALGAVWALHTMVDHTALWYWLASHLLFVSGVYAVQRWWLRAQRAPHHNAWALFFCMLAMGLSWGSISWVCVAYGQPLALVFSIALVGGGRQVHSAWEGHFCWLI